MAIRDIVQAAAGSGTPENYYINLEDQSSITKSSYLYSPAQDSDGNIYVGGHQDAVNSGQFQGIIIKYDPDGARVWSKYYLTHTSSPVSSAPVEGLTVGPDDHLYWVQTNYGSSSRATITKADLDGNVVWRYDYSLASIISPRISLDSSGNIYLIGAYNSSYRAILVKFNSSMTIQWQYYYAASQPTLLSYSDIQFDSSGNMYLAGYQATSTSYTLYGPSIMKVNSSGVFQWGRFLVPRNASGDNGFVTGNIALDSSGNVYFASDWYDGSVGNTDMVVGKLNSSGAVQWLNRIRPSHTTTQPEVSYGIAGYDTVNDVFFPVIRMKNQNSTTANNLNWVAVNSSGVAQWNRYITGVINNIYATTFSFTPGRENRLFGNSILMCGSTSTSQTVGLGMGGPAFFVKVPTDDSLGTQTVTSASHQGVTANLTYNTETLSYASQSYTDLTSSYPISRTTLSNTVSVNSSGNQGSFTPAFFNTMLLT